MLFIAFICFLGACRAGFIADETLNPAKLSDLKRESENPLLPSQHPGYFLYNILQVNPRPIPLVGFPYGQPASSSFVTSSLNYYGAPLYDYRIQLSPLLPDGISGVIHHQPAAFIPSYTPQQPISTTPRPFNEFESDEEDFDEKAQHHGPAINSPNDDSSLDNDSVVIEAVD